VKHMISQSTHYGRFSPIGLNGWTGLPWTKFITIDDINNGIFALFHSRHRPWCGDLVRNLWSHYTIGLPPDAEAPEVRTRFVMTSKVMITIC
jgi:hypothetical protein